MLTERETQAAKALHAALSFKEAGALLDTTPVVTVMLAGDPADTRVVTIGDLRALLAVATRWQEGPPWMADICAALGWQGGAWSDVVYHVKALNAARAGGGTPPPHDGR